MELNYLEMQPVPGDNTTFEEGSWLTEAFGLRVLIY